MLSVSELDMSSRRVSMSSGGDQSPPGPEDGVGSRRNSRVQKNDLLLHEAVIKNDPDGVREVLKEPVNVNCRNNYGRAPIHWAASRGNTEIIEMLIGAKCDIEAKDKYGMRPLLMAAWHGHRDAVRLLINSGANVHAVNRKEYDVVMCAVRNNCVEVVDLLVETLERLDLSAKDVEGNGALHHAAAAGHTAIVEKLLSLGAEPNNTNRQGRTPLHLCCEKGHEGVCQLLIGRQASLEAADQQGNTPLHVTVNNKHSQLAQVILLANNGVVDIENSEGMTALHIASSIGCRGVIESLVQCGSNIDKQNKNGNTALHLACAANDLETVELLISKGADLNSLNERLQSPIHIAAEYGYTEICQMLLTAGANIEQKEQGGRTPLYIAARGSFTAIVDMIIKTARLDYPEQENPETEKSPIAITVQRKYRLNQNTQQGPHHPVELEVNRPREVPDSVRELVKRLAYQQLGPRHWKQLATHWAFTHEQIKAIEHQYTGPCSYKEHGLRMMTIWLEGLGADVDPMKNLYESLLAINQKRIAEMVRKKMNEDITETSNKSSRLCSKSCSLF